MPSNIKYTPELFWATTDQSGPCWLWLGRLNRDGYGVLSYQGKVERAHRVAYRLHNCELPPLLDHICRVRNCVNPAHLRPATIRENVLSGVGITAREAQQTKCKRGHEFNEENTYTYGVTRICRICRRVNAKNYKKRLKESSGDV